MYKKHLIRYDILAKYPKIKKLDNVGLKSITICANNNNIIKNDRLVLLLVKQITSITGQFPAYLVARKNNSSFNIRTGNIVGIVTSMTNKNMLNFLKKYLYCVISLYKKASSCEYEQNSKSNCMVYSTGFNTLNYWPELDKFSSTWNEAFGASVEIKIQGNKDINKFLLSRLFKIKGQ